MEERLREVRAYGETARERKREGEDRGNDRVIESEKGARSYGPNFEKHPNN